MLQAMTHSYAVKVLDLICAPPTDNPYGHLKEGLLRMYALTDYAGFEAISSLSLSGDMLPSTLMLKMLALLPAGHNACFFLQGAFLKSLPDDVRGPLVNTRTTDPLSLALCADEIYQSRVSAASTLNHISSTPVECPVLAVCSPSVFCSCSNRSPTPGPRHHHPSAPSSTSRCSDSPGLCWYHRNHAEQAHKCRSPCS